jgi:predicted molibdopterin-dependent oxidoreductase YjgC
MRRSSPEGREGGLVEIRRRVELTVDGTPVRVAEGDTIRQACEQAGVATPTLCFAENLTPVHACRVCVVEVEGARTLVPACARPAEPGMVVRTDSPRVRASRKMVLELLGSTVDMTAAPEFGSWCAHYGADPARLGVPEGRPVVDDNPLFVRDYDKCMLCYKCVQACGEDAQHTHAIVVAGRGEHARIATEYDVSLPDSACVFCGNCVGVCPTAALQFREEHTLRARGAWDPSRQTVTRTVCPYCGVGCALELHVQDARIVRVTSPSDSSVTDGHLCVKGRFGWGYAQPTRNER